MVSRSLGLAVLGLLLAMGAQAGEATRAFVRELSRSGRAEATLRFSTPAALGRARPLHATLALERPGFARLDVTSTGEKLTLRPDGGEWLQPAVRELIRYGVRQGAVAMRWWRVLLDPEGVEERRLADGHWRLWLAASRDSADLWLDARGRPSRLVIPEEAGGGTYQLSAWRFGGPRGAAAYRLTAPAGWETVELP